MFCICLCFSICVCALCFCVYVFVCVFMFVFFVCAFLSLFVFVSTCWCLFFVYLKRYVSFLCLSIVRFVDRAAPFVVLPKPTKKLGYKYIKIPSMPWRFGTSGV